MGKLAATERTKRYQASCNKAFDFMAAWSIFSLFQTLYEPMPVTSCYPAGTPHAIQNKNPDTQVVMSLAVMIFLVLAGTSRCYADARTKHPASLIPDPRCWVSFAATCLTIVKATLGIQIGWSVSELYFAIMDYSAFKGAFTGGIVAAFVLIVGALTFSSAKGKWKHQQSTAIIPPGPEPHAAQRFDTV